MRHDGRARDLGRGQAAPRRRIHRGDYEVRSIQEHQSFRNAITSPGDDCCRGGAGLKRGPDGPQGSERCLEVTSARRSTCPRDLLRLHAGGRRSRI